MKPNLRLLAVPIVLTMLTGASCSTLNERLTQAARMQGEAEAERDSPPLPDDCRVLEPHAPVIIGGEALSGWKRERHALDRANARVVRCAGFYDAVTGKPKV